MSFVKTEVRDQIGYVILDRPEKRNALNHEFVEDLKGAIKSYEALDSIKAIILKSSSQVFCAGADLEYLRQLQANSFEENLSDSQKLAELFHLIYANKKPVVSIVKGPAIAGGCGLATVCDLCFSAPGATYGYTEARIGFIPAIVMIFLRKKVKESISKNILFSGNVFKASIALEYGLITEIIDSASIDEKVHQLVSQMVQESSSNSLAMIKQMYAETDNLNLEEGLKYAAYMNATARESEDCKKGIQAFIDKQKIKW